MNTNNSSSFEVKFFFEQKVSGVKKIHLSLAQYTPPAKKKLTEKKHTIAARKTPLEHAESLFKDGRLDDLDQPLLLISVRNVLANLRCIAYLNKITERPISVAEEFKQFSLSTNGNFPSNRPYHILGEKKGKLVIEEWNPQKSIDYSWFISGIPVLWDDEDPYKLYQRIVTEAADHSHVWHIPRGNNPEATDKKRNQWNHLQDIFNQTISDTRSAAFKLLNEYAEYQKLEREDDYLHSILGVDSDGYIRQIIKSGRLENLGQTIKTRGVKRAICVDNGGSIAVDFYPDGLAAAINGQHRRLVSAPNHRLPGTAYLVIELKNRNFSYL